MTLYGLVFRFLTDVIGWYNEKTYKKVLKSFSENLHKDFEQQVEDILKCARAIKDRALILGQGAELRYTRLASEAAQKLLADVHTEHQSFQHLTTIRWNEARREQSRILDLQQRRLLASADQRQDLAGRIVQHMPEPRDDTVEAAQLSPLSTAMEDIRLLPLGDNDGGVVPCKSRRSTDLALLILNSSRAWS